MNDIVEPSSQLNSERVGSGGTGRVGWVGRSGGSSRVGRVGRSGGSSRVGWVGRSGGSSRVGWVGRSGGSSRVGWVGRSGGSSRVGWVGRSGGSSRVVLSRVIVLLPSPRRSCLFARRRQNEKFYIEQLCIYARCGLLRRRPHRRGGHSLQQATGPTPPKLAFRFAGGGRALVRVSQCPTS